VRELIAEVDDPACVRDARGERRLEAQQCVHASPITMSWRSTAERVSSASR
jgi:hypothetical protein